MYMQYSRGNDNDSYIIQFELSDLGKGGVTGGCIWPHCILLWIFWQGDQFLRGINPPPLYQYTLYLANTALIIPYLPDACAIYFAFYILHCKVAVLVQMSALQEFCATTKDYCPPGIPGPPGKLYALIYCLGFAV